MGKTKFCKTCKLPDWYITYYGDLKLDTNDNCFFCNHYEGSKGDYTIDYKSQEREFKQLVEKNRGRGEYDCIVLYTGGKDSSYTLYMMAKVYGMKTLALTWDNGFFNDSNTENIEVLAENLGVDHRYIKTDPEILKCIYRNRLENYGRFCNCVPLCFLYTAPIMYETKAPLIFFSSSYGQIIGLSEMNTRIDPETCRASSPMNEVLKLMGTAPIKNVAKEQYYTILLDLLVGSLPPKVLDEMKHLLGYMEKLMSVEDAFYVNPSCYFDWDISNIIQKINGYGWKSPENKGKFGHTSCIAEKMKGYLSYRQGLINFDVIENSVLLRTGKLNMEDFAREMESTGFSDEEPDVCDLFLEKTGLSRGEMNHIIHKKTALRENLPEINKESLTYLSVPMPEDELKENLKRVFKTQLTI